MWVAVGVLAVVWVVIVVYASIVLASDDDDREMRDYRQAKAAFERIFE